MTDDEAVESGFGVSPPGAERRVTSFTIRMDNDLNPRFARLEAKVSLSSSSHVVISGECPLEIPEFGHELARFANYLIYLAK